jgi:hypothetical protein
MLLVIPAVATPTPWVAALVLVVVMVVALRELPAMVPEVVSVAVQDRLPATAPGVQVTPTASVLALAAGVVVVTTVVQATAVAAALDPAVVASTKILVPSRSKLYHQLEPSIRVSICPFYYHSFCVLSSVSGVCESGIKGFVFVGGVGSPAMAAYFVSRFIVF